MDEYIQTLKELSNELDSLIRSTQDLKESLIILKEQTIREIIRMPFYEARAEEKWADVSKEGSV